MSASSEISDEREWLIVSGEAGEEYVLSGKGEIHVSGITDRFTLYKKDKANILDLYTLYPNYPNPFNAVTTISYDLPEASEVSLIVYDLMGKKVSELVSGRVVSGSHRVIWDGTDGNGSLVSSGIYLYRLQSGGYLETRKLVFLK